VVVARFDGRQHTLDEVHRFATAAVRVAGHLHWDVLRVYDEVLCGLARAVRQSGPITSIGVDSWGVDFGLLDRTGALIGNPYHYRDDRTDGVMQQVFARVPREEIFEITGVQFLRLNTLYQLYAMVLADSPALDQADRLLMMPDLINYWLTGEKLGEYTIATTTQAYDAARRTWAFGLLERLDLPIGILPPVIQPGTVVGRLLRSVADSLGLTETVLVAPACHDTGSAVAAVPASGDDYAYISSGTWSLMGVVVPGPLITDRARDYNFTNEGGVGGTIRLLKNISGLWPLQECRRAWARAGEELSYAELTHLAEQAKPLQAVVDPNHYSLLSPDDMPRALRELCASTGQQVPSHRGELVRMTLESLACMYRMTLEQLHEITGRCPSAIHVVGGGSQNRLLCQLTANACARPVLAGPVETSALGNVLAQTLAAGECATWAEARDIARRAFPVVEYEPHEPGSWDEIHARFRSIVS
jgi:rhamnulokinase